LIYGTRVSLSVGFVAVSLYVILGVIIGAIAGYYGGWVDFLISRVIEIMICFPTFFLILAVLAFVGPSIYNIMIVIGITSWPGIARLVRGEFLRLRNQDFVLAGRVVGVSSLRLIFRHILPNSLAPVLVAATFGIASAILVESGLSFLGFGVQPPTPSWGEALSQSRDFMDIAWWLALFPGIAIFLTITAYNLVGEGLRDAIDPRMKV
jgi:peptide/nickel transport system permease protein